MAHRHQPPIPLKPRLSRPDASTYLVQTRLGRGWSLEVGYVGTKGTHLRETSDRNQARLASPQNPITVTAQSGTQFVITQNTLANLSARARYLGIAPTGLEAF